MKEILRVATELVVSEDGEDLFDKHGNEGLNNFAEETEKLFEKAVNGAAGKKIKLTVIIEQLEE